MIDIQGELSKRVDERWLEINQRFSNIAIVEWDRLYDSGEGRVFSFSCFIARRKQELWWDLGRKN